MKTTINRTFDKIFQGAAIVGLSTLFLFNETAYAQQSELAQSYLQAEMQTFIPGKLQGNIFPSLDPLVIKVVFVNPAKESITLIIRNDDREVVYTKVIGKTESYNSKLDVSSLPDGNYTFQIYAISNSVSKKIQISTQLARLTHVE